MGIMRTTVWVGALLLTGMIIGAGNIVWQNLRGSGGGTSMINSAWNEISNERLLEMVKVLSSDEYEGRAPASKGEELTTAFIETQFRRLGLKPGNPDGTYFQKVPMVGIIADPSAELVFADPTSGQRETLRYGDDFVAWTKRQQAKVSIDAEMIFVGYGVVAPEYQWDDYKGVDVKGKVLVMLINDPPVPDPNDPAKLDEAVFKGNAMTYYGRWTYKFEIAAEKGAAGCLIIHETDPAGYPWAVVRGSNSGELFSLVTADKGMSRSPVEGWMTLEKAKALFAITGKDLEALKKTAVSRNFQPVPLGTKASLTVKNGLRTIKSRNVIARQDGRDPQLKNEYVIYMAHWDHLGVGSPVDGDRIYHGAEDNASGVAGLLETARAYKKVRPALRRSILFIADTGEEQGLLGSQYYAEHPVYPLAKTLAVINMDGLNCYGRTRDIGVIGLGMSTLDDYVKAVASEQERVVKADAEPEKGFYYRSDHFCFAKQGVPALDPNPGTDYIGKPEGWGMEIRNRYTREDYHKPSDQIKPDWNLSGAVQDLQLLSEIGYRISNADSYPTWNPGTEFKAKRDQMMKK